MPERRHVHDRARVGQVRTRVREERGSSEGNRGAGQLNGPNALSPSPSPTPTLTVSRNDLNMLVKTAHDRRQNFTDDQASAILNWNRRRKSGTDDLKKLFG